MYETNPALTRSSARKSRITDSFFEAKEKLEEIIESHKDEKLIPPFEGSSPGQTIITLSKDFINHTLGIELLPIYDLNHINRLRAVEICKIDSEGRVAADGRIKVGDHITEINQRPVYQLDYDFYGFKLIMSTFQMSISRAQAYLHEIQSTPHPSLTIDRPVESFLNSGFLVHLSPWFFLNI
ncbi:unnamed protein product [Dracunculus medinensis]|uniref:PDZ domain-containing protein n=1 Tax=Dracunculus medinensis TaxID=318479 RepID=A0A0N4U7T8_DRAME|nr:unnamed protein product [Dracunculus medinensis]